MNYMRLVMYAILWRRHFWMSVWMPGLVKTCCLQKLEATAHIVHIAVYSSERWRGVYPNNLPRIAFCNGRGLVT